MSIPFIITDKNVTIVLHGKQYSLDKKHENTQEIIDLVSGKIVLSSADLDIRLEELLNPGKQIESFSQGLLKIDNGSIYYNTGKEDLKIEVDSSLIERIKDMNKEGYNVASLVGFFENLMLNTSYHAVTGLYKFLERNKLPITDDGCFLAYKRIRWNWFDIKTNTFDNHIGLKPSMLRNQVDENPDNTCSKGLHFAALDYAANHYGSYDKDDRMIIVKINPKDVVAFPNDYNGQKGRCCEYEVIEEIQNNGLDYLLHGFQGIKTITQMRDKIDEIRNLIKKYFKDSDYKIYDVFSDVHKTKIEKLVNDIAGKYNIKAEVFNPIEELSIYGIIKIISNEVDLSDIK
jgi:hypothetical protein